MKPSRTASALGKFLCVNIILCSILSMFLCVQVYYEKGLVLILIIGVVGNSILLAMAPTFWEDSGTAPTIGGELATRAQPVTSKDESRVVKCLLKLILWSEIDQDNVIGDLVEECAQYQPKVRARRWLYTQVIKSVPPLLYENAKRYLASYLRGAIR